MSSKSSQTVSAPRYRSAFGALLLTTSGLATASVALPGQALAQSVRSYDVPAGSLASAVNSFAEQSGVQILYDAALTNGRSSAGLRGQFGVVDGLFRLLDGSGVTFRQTGANVFTLESAPQAAEGTVQLGTLRVEGASGVGVGRTRSGGEAVTDPADRPYRATGSAAYIPQAQIEQRRGTSTGDFLSGTPGVLVGDNRNGAALDVNIRGMQGQGRVPVVIDGAQQEATVWRGYAGIAGRSYIDPDLIGDVTIGKGPSADIDTPGAIGGVVRMNTLTANDVVLPGRRFGVRIRGAFNSNSRSIPPIDTVGGLYGAGNYATSALPRSFGGPDGLDRPGFLTPTGGSGSIAVAYASDWLEVLGAYVRRKNGNYFGGTSGDHIPRAVIGPQYGWVRVDGKLQSVPLPGRSTVTFDGLNRFRAGEEVLNTSQDNTSYLLKGVIRPALGHKLELSAMRYESDYGEMMPSQIVRGAGAFQAALNSVKMNSYTAKYSWDPVDNDLIRARLGFWLTESEMVVPYQWFGYNPALYPDIANAYGNTNRRWGLNFENRSTFQGSLGTLSLTVGGTYTRETIKPADNAHRGAVRDGNRREFSLFVGSEWKPLEWLTLAASMRYSSYKSQDTGPAGSTYFYRAQLGSEIRKFEDSDDYAAFLAKNPTATELNPISEYFYRGVFETYKADGSAPMASATIEPWRGIQFYAKYAEALRLPSLFETTRGFSIDALSTASMIALKPERARTWEIGANILRDGLLRPGDKLRVKASYFDNHVDDYLTRTQSIFGGTSITNIDSADLKGFEVSAAYDLGPVFIDAGWSHYLSTSFCTFDWQRKYTPAKQRCYPGGTPNGYVVNHVPPKDTVNLTLGTRLLQNRLTVSGRMIHIGDRGFIGLGDGYKDTGGTLVFAEWKPYTVFDLFGSFKVSEQLKLDVAVDNVTDVYYMDPLTLSLMPSPGRTLRAGFTVKF